MTRARLLLGEEALSASRRAWLRQLVGLVLLLPVIACSPSTRVVQEKQQEKPALVIVPEGKAKRAVPFVRSVKDADDKIYVTLGKRLYGELHEVKNYEVSTVHETYLPGTAPGTYVAAQLITGGIFLPIDLLTDAGQSRMKSVLLGRTDTATTTTIRYDAPRPLGREGETEIAWRLASVHLELRPGVSQLAVADENGVVELRKFDLLKKASPLSSFEALDVRLHAEIGDERLEHVVHLSSADIRAYLPQLGLESSGSGFFIDSDGHILTNAHVVDGCGALTAKMSGRFVRLSLVREDRRNDIALLTLNGWSGPSAELRDTAARSGEPAIAVGFPLADILSEEPNVTVGVVSAQSGLGGDSRLLQMTAPIQPGNSGGPVLDRDGKVIGMVVASLNAIKMAVITGNIPENVNFAIKNTQLLTFLNSSDLHPKRAAVTSSGKAPSTEDIADAAKKFTLYIQCWKSE